MHNMAIDYGHGDEGLPLDQAKCIELLREAAGLGFPDANFQADPFVPRVKILPSRHLILKV